MGQALVSSIIVIALFAVCTTVIGFKPTLWIFGSIHLSCALGVLLLWWRDEVRWGGGPRESTAHDPLRSVPIDRPSRSIVALEAPESL